MKYQEIRRKESYACYNRYILFSKQYELLSKKDYSKIETKIINRKSRYHHLSYSPIKMISFSWQMLWRLYFHHIMDGRTNFSKMHFILKYEMVFVQKIFVQKSREVSDENKWNDVVKLSIYSNIQQNPIEEIKLDVSIFH